LAHFGSENVEPQGRDAQHAAALARVGRGRFRRAGFALALAQPHYLDLIGHHAKGRAYIVRLGAGESQQMHRAAKRLELREVRRVRRRLQFHRQQARHRPHDGQGVFAAKEAIRIGPVAEGGHGTGSIRRGSAADNRRGPVRQFAGRFRRRRRVFRFIQRGRKRKAARLGIRRQPAVAFHIVDPAVDLVHRCHEAVEVFRRQHRIAAPGLIQARLGTVQQALGGRHFEQGHRALQGVDRAEQAVEHVAAFGLARQGHQIALRLRHEIPSLDQELFEQFVHHERR